MTVDVGARKQNVGLQISSQTLSMPGFAVQLPTASEGDKFNNSPGAVAAALLAPP